jgi:hypothetical protein
MQQWVGVVGNRPARAGFTAAVAVRSRVRSWMPGQICNLHVKCYTVMCCMMVVGSGMTRHCHFESAAVEGISWHLVKVQLPSRPAGLAHPILVRSRRAKAFWKADIQTSTVRPLAQAADVNRHCCRPTGSSQAAGNPLAAGRLRSCTTHMAELDGCKAHERLYTLDTWPTIVISS